MPNIVKITTIINPFDLIAPHSCRGCGKLGQPFCDCCKNYLISNRINYCPNCKAKNPTGQCKKCNFLPPIFVVEERSTLIGQLVHDLKYSSVRALAKPLAELLDKTLPNLKGEISVVPLPTIPQHIRSRGLDHTFLIAKKLSKLRGNNYKVEKLLYRTTNTVQVGADEKTRLAQASTSYRIKSNVKINPNTTYILFDDVWTTGASMRTALKKLREAGAKKIIIAILAVNRLN